MTDAELRAYLLRQSSDADAARVEERLLEDEDVFAALRGLEDDLFDDHARGRLDAADREQFLARYGNQADRLTFAQALARRAARGGAFAGRRASMLRRQWMPLAAAATLAIAVSGVLMTQNERQPQTADAPAAVSGPVVAPVTALVRLTLGTSRTAGAAVPVALPADVSFVRLRVALNPADRFDSYAMELRASSDNIVWGDAALRSSTDGAEFSIEGGLPARSVADGRYELAVYGVNTTGSREPLGFVTLQVERAR